jgi:DNA-binding response OmpR family regulator
MTKLLVIEDETVLRESILQLLGFAGYEGIGAENGLIGVELALSDLPDLIICDIRMPEMDGFAVIREIRGNPVTENIPFIFVTAKADLVDVDKGLQLGANAYITKPFNYDELLTAIKECLK